MPRLLLFAACLLLVPLAARADAMALLDSGWWQAQLSSTWWQAQLGLWTDWQSREPTLFLLTFLAVFTLLAAFTLPGCAVLSLLAGTWFGAVGGTLLVGLASTLGAMLSFLVARHLLPARWQARLHSRWGPRMRQLEAMMQRRSGLWLVGLRLVPVVPFPVLNPLLGLTAMPMRRFFWPSLAGLTLGSLPYVLAGLSLLDFWRTGQLAWSTLAAAGLVALAVWAAWAGSRLRR